MRLALVLVSRYVLWLSAGPQALRGVPNEISITRSVPCHSCTGSTACTCTNTLSRTESCETTPRNSMGSPSPPSVHTNHRLGLFHVYRKASFDLPSTNSRAEAPTDPDLLAALGVPSFLKSTPRPGSATIQRL